MRPLFRALLLLLAAGCATTPPTPPPPPEMQTLTLRLTQPSGEVNADVYLPASADPAPWMLVAHGFSRRRANMAGWGRFLASHGVVAIVPDLPAWSDHPRNARFLAEAARALPSHPELAGRLLPDAYGLMGFSAGGLSSLLAAAQLEDARLWIGLDPVDRGALGQRAAAKLRCPAFLLLADPSSCNAQGNGAALADALPQAVLVRIEGASHVDAENPTDFLAERICGASTPARRAAFQREVLRALPALKGGEPLQSSSRPPR